MRLVHRSCHVGGAGRTSLWTNLAPPSLIAETERVTEIRVLIVDDEALVRRALAVFVRSADGMVIVGEASDGAQAVAACAALRPDVVLMDIRMQGVGGIEAIAQIADTMADVRVIAVTTFGSDDTVLAALRAGAVGFLVKDSEPDQVIAAIRGVHEGGYVLSPRVARELINSVGKAQPGSPLEPNQQVSDRERGVIALLAQGMSNAEIAQALFLSEATVKSHLRRIMSRWGVRDRVQLLVRAARAGIIEM